MPQIQDLDSGSRVLYESDIKLLIESKIGSCWLGHTKSLNSIFNEYQLLPFIGALFHRSNKNIEKTYSYFMARYNEIKTFQGY